MSAYFGTPVIEFLKFLYLDFFPKFQTMAAESDTGKFRVIIAGGGIAGLTLANALQHAGIDFVLLEGRSEIAPQVGASIGTFPNGSRILDQLGCYDEIWNMTAPLTVTGDHYGSGEYITGESEDIQLLNSR
jgi:hypothetical protein